MVKRRFMAVSVTLSAAALLAVVYAGGSSASAVTAPRRLAPKLRARPTRPRFRTPWL